MESVMGVSKRAVKLASEGKLQDAINALQARLNIALDAKDVEGISLLCQQLSVYDEQLNGPAAGIRWATLALEWNPQSSKFAYAIADGKFRLGLSDDARVLALRALTLAKQTGDEDVLELLSSHTAFRHLAD